MQAMQVSSTAERIARVIFEHAARISKEKEISRLAELNADLARDLTGAERCSLWLLDGNGELCTRVAHEMTEIRIPRGLGIVGACIEQNEPIIINDAQSDARLFSRIDNQSGYQTHSIACVPLTGNGQVIVAVQLLNKPGGFSVEDTDLLRLMAIYASSAIQSERLRQEAEAAELFRRELEVAAEVQRRLLPSIEARWSGIQVAALCLPARCVGGDFYDLLELPGANFGLTLGDVSGKGFPAAVLMASIHMLLRSLLLHSPNDLARVLEELNDVIQRNSTAERYATLLCGVLNASRTRLTYVNAGHIPPFIVRTAGHVERPDGADLPAGLLPGIRYQQHIVSLSPGDLIVCLSDGITEAQEPDGELRETDAIEKILKQSRSAPVDEILNRLVRAANQHGSGAEQADDMTAMVMRV
ncbi:MAG TPA: SpoIIE family protein phosphatase [Candidatus Binatia bacterium]|nr:SpoIIE family protein phosphatase [Candidatus Binatia bacterium]